MNIAEKCLKRHFSCFYKIRMLFVLQDDECHKEQIESILHNAKHYKELGQEYKEMEDTQC